MMMMDDTKAVMSNKSWTGKDIAQLMELKGKGFSNADIADHIGRSSKAVGVKWSKLRKSMRATTKLIDPLPDEFVDFPYAGSSPAPQPPKVEEKVNLPTFDGSAWSKPDDAFRVSRNVIYGLAIILAAIIGWYVGSKI
tara:strand:+ start:472 stop:885 length:414 start_codon:yes stop_codon:yes gene_type:complete